MKYNYYYNNVPGSGLCRNNLIYTSLANEDKTVFVQWYSNDTEYHKGENQVVDPLLMNEKFKREVKYLKLMNTYYPDLTPKILDIDETEQKIFLEIQGSDFWEQAGCKLPYEHVADWQEQMLDIIKAHKHLGLYKYSMHPSSYFLINGRLKSINYFFTYHKDEPSFSIKDVESHIYSTRQEEMRKYLASLGIVWDQPCPFNVLERLCWESFRTNYPPDFIEKVICLI